MKNVPFLIWYRGTCNCSRVSVCFSLEKWCSSLYIPDIILEKIFFVFLKSSWKFLFKLIHITSDPLWIKTGRVLCKLCCIFEPTAHLWTENMYFSNIPWITTAEVFWSVFPPSSLLDSDLGWIVIGFFRCPAGGAIYTNNERWNCSFVFSPKITLTSKMSVVRITNYSVIIPSNVPIQIDNVNKTKV